MAAAKPLHAKARHWLRSTYRFVLLFGLPLGVPGRQLTRRLVLRGNPEGRASQLEVRLLVLNTLRCSRLNYYWHMGARVGRRLLHFALASLCASAKQTT